MSRSWFCVLAAALVVAAQPVFAQPSDDGSSAEAANARPARTVSLRALLDVVVHQNDELIRTAADLAIAEADVLADRGLDDWELSATGLWVSKRRGFVAGNPFQTTAEDTGTLSAGLTRALPTGGTVGVTVTGTVADLTFAVLDNNGDRFDIDTTALSGSVIASVSHPLLGGSGRTIARAGRRRAALSRDAAVLQREVAATNVVRDVVASYWELAYAIASRAIQQQSLDLAREQLRITRLAIDQRVAAPTEALAIEQAIAVREQEVMLAEVQISERSLELRRLVGLEIGPGEVLLGVGDTPDASAAPFFDLDSTLTIARERNPRLAVVRLLADTAAIDVEVAADGTRSRLDVAGTIGPDASSTEVGETLKQIGLLESFSATGSITYRQSLGKHASRGAYQRALESARRARVDIAAMEREIAVEVVRAINLVRTARKRIEVSDLAIQLSETNLENEKVLVQAGDSRAFDVLARQDELAKARLSRERALVDYLTAVVGVEALTGDLLTRYGVAATSDR